MPLNAVLLIGPTGSGKSPLGDRLEKTGLNGRRCLHFDFGHQLRSIAGDEGPPAGFTKDEHSFIRGVLERGLLLENEHFYLAEKIIRSYLAQRISSESDVLVLNGLPRHVDQAKDIDRILDVIGIVVLACSAEEVFKRIRSNTGGDRAGRVDDSFDMVVKKLGIYDARTRPIIDHYSGRGCTVCRTNCSSDSSAEEIYADICSAFI